MTKERTLVLCKPDALQRGLVGRIVERFEAKGLKIVGLKMLQVDASLASKHYEAHVEKPFYRQLEAFITAAPVVAMVLEGEAAVDVVRCLMGTTDPKQAAPGTVRGDLGMNLTMNLVHGSDGPASAQREISLFFADHEMHEYDMTVDAWR
jgi:nucleoside-diphosphate kinase